MRARIVAIAVFSFVAGIVFGVCGLAVAQSSNDRFKVFNADGLVLEQRDPPKQEATVQAPTADARIPVTLRISGRRDGRVVGTLVAYVNGKWMEVQLAPQDSFLK